MQIDLNKGLWKALPYLAVALFFGLYITFSGLRTFEPDNYFHYALSRLITEKGVIMGWPELSDIGWAANFTDKEFLFHQLTSLGYRFFGTAGVDAVCTLFSIGILLLLLKLTYELTESKLAPLILIAGITNLAFFFRLGLIRPHLAGIFLSLVILLGLVKNNRWIIALGAFLFPLAYHAFYLPSIIMCGFILFQRNLKTILIFGFLPLLCGILVNPYFPGTILISWLGIQIGFNSSLATNLGTEAKSLPFLQSLITIGLYSVITLAISFTLNREEKKKLAPYILIAMIFQGLYFINPRAIEYLVPSFIVFIAASFKAMTAKYPRYPYFIISVMVLMNVLYLPHFFKRGNEEVHNRSLDVLSVLDQLPLEPQKRVFNCEWDIGSLVLFKKPGMKVNEVLDPNFIHMAQPELGKMKKFILYSPPPDLYYPLKKIFKADYVLCLTPAVVKILNEDPRFIRLAVGTTNPPPHLYRVKVTNE